MPLQDTDVTLVSRGSTNANASMTQVKDYVLDGLTSSDALVWSSYPTTANNHISSANTKFDGIGLHPLIQAASEVLTWISYQFFFASS